MDFEVLDYLYYIANIFTCILVHYVNFEYILLEHYCKSNDKDDMHI